MSHLLTARVFRNPMAVGLLWLVVVTAISGCSTLALRDNTLIPTRHQIDVGPYVVHSNFPLPSDSLAVVELGRLRSQVEQALEIPIDAPTGSIEVYILDDSRAFAHFLNTYYHELPQRRAFFLAQGERRVVYTFLGDRLAEDLRHEATHALLHTIVSDMPLWLDEGLAEYFEDAGAVPGDNPEHLDRLADELQRRWKPDLAHLEEVRQVRDMTPRDYREAWAWVHFLIHESPWHRDLLSGYLRQLGSGGDPIPLSEQLAARESAPDQALAAHVRAMLRGSQLAKTEGHSRPTVRLQSHAPPVDPSLRRAKAVGSATVVLGNSESRGSFLGDVTRGFFGLFRRDR